MEFAEHSTWRIYKVHPYLPKVSIHIQANFFFLYLIYVKIGASVFSNPFDWFWFSLWFLITWQLIRFRLIDKKRIKKWPETTHKPFISNWAAGCTIPQGLPWWRQEKPLNSNSCMSSFRKSPFHWFGTWGLKISILNRWPPYLINVFKLKIKGSSN